jgi:hypothetical protein
MLRTAAVALAVVPAIDSLMFGGACTHLVEQVASARLQHIFRKSTALIKQRKVPTAWSASFSRFEHFGF